MSESHWEISCLTPEEKSALKRCVGKMMGSDMRAMKAFYHAIGYRWIPNEEIYFASLCMACLWDAENCPKTEAFEIILHDMYHDKDATDSTKHKVTAFFDIPWGEDGFLLGKICSLVRRIHAENTVKMPDFEKLADDLKNWNHPNKFVQRRWIRKICVEDQMTKKMEEEKNVD